MFCGHMSVQKVVEGWLHQLLVPFWRLPAGISSAHC